MFPKVLNNKRILICRPQSSAASLSEALKAVGAECYCFPTLEIRPKPFSEPQKQAILALDQYAIVIACSQHAANIALDYIDQYWPQFPTNQTWIPLGQKTAQRLLQEGINTLEINNDLTSEMLLSLPILQKVKHLKTLILKGDGGRDVLENALIKRGAQVDCLALYRRECPKYSDHEIKQALIDFQADYIICLSGETLSNLFSLCELADINLSSKTFIVPSHRVANIAYEQGFKSVLIPDNLNPIDLIKCISKHNKTK